LTDLGGRLKKSVSIFNVIKFQNGICTANDGKNGTCYTDTECDELQGIPGGSCAEGYGVCCVFSLRCGQQSSENCTYFQSSGTEQGACNAKICAKPGVCQLRLDFPKFAIGQPSVSTVSAFNTLQGTILPAAATTPVSTMGQCLTDTFTVTSPGSVTPPVICGTNDGQHMYVEASDACNILSFQLAGIGKYAWEIKITQLDCFSNELAPTGCTQYHFGSISGTVQSFNYVGGTHLANQNQLICIRRELNMCRICYATAMAMNVFDISGKASTAANSMALMGFNSLCCGYGMDGLATLGYDCVIIPGASKKTAGVNTAGQPTNGDLKISEFCGRQLGTHLSTVTLGARATVCSRVIPFQLRFLSDNFEVSDGAGGGEAAKDGDGFEVHYTQSKCS